MATSQAAPPCSPETTDLERRVLAHERILQSLIAYISRTEPRFVNHLKERFVEPMKMARHEHDFRNVDDYAEEFIHAIMLIGETSKPAILEERKSDTTATGARATFEKTIRSTLQPDRVQMKERSGTWEVRIDGAFWGDYCKREQALAAMALAKLSLH